MANIKTFIGVRASDRVTRNVASVVRRLGATCDNYRWIEPENLHVTLNYVGDVVDIEVPELCKIIKEAIKPFGPFEMSLQGVSGFASAEEPRVLWMGVDQGRDELTELFNSLADVLHHWGVNKERNEFLPHMTLGRLGRNGRWSDELLALVHKLRHHDGGFCHVKEIIVYSSFMEKRGPTYTPMATLKL